MLSTWLAILALAPCAAFAGEPCTPQLDPSFTFFPTSAAPNGPVYASAVHDDGSGPKLYIAGRFDRIGSTLCRDVACWDGTQWSALGTAYSPAGTTGGFTSIGALAVFDDGSGSALYAGGRFSTNLAGTAPIALARWDGAAWSVPGGGVVGDVDALLVHDDGSGAALYAAGMVSSAGGSPAARIARWNGSAWSTVPGFQNNGTVRLTSLAIYDSGAGPELYAGGRFFAAQGAPGDLIARWNGTSWSAVGTGLAGPGTAQVSSLRAFDDGSGSRLFVGGYFDQAGGAPANSVAAWNGTSWSAAGAGFTGDVRAFESFDDGGGTELYAGGFMFDGSGLGFHRWNRASWSSAGGGVIGGAVDTLLSFSVGGDARLFVGGEYSSTTGIAQPRATTWDGTSWGSLGSAPEPHGVDGVVFGLHAHDDGGGPALYATGSMSSRVVRRTDAGWSPLGSGLTGFAYGAIATYDDGTGPALYVGGEFASAGGVPAKNVARWDGAGWSAVGGGVGNSGVGSVRAAAVFDDGSGPALYVAGTFQDAGGESATNVARWNGTSWSGVGDGLGPIEGGVGALCVFDDGTGPALFAGGRFDVDGGSAGYAVAGWDGASWTDLGIALGAPASASRVAALCVFDDGTGAQLYAGGDFATAGGVPAAAIARWNGASWSALLGTLAPLASSSLPFVDALRVFDAGDGPALFVGGGFSAAGGAPAGSLARWRDGAWSAVGSGVGGLGSRVFALEAFDDDGDGRMDLFVGGSFFTAGPYLASYVACWRSCAETVTSFCAGDGSVASCPCANSGASGHGCENSGATGGASLEASGLTNPDTLVLTASGELPTSLSVFTQGNLALANPLPFGDGVRCVGGALKRLYVGNASAGTISRPALGDPSISARSGVLGDPIGSGSTRYYYVYYRDPNLAFCPSGGGFNVGNALKVTW